MSGHYEPVMEWVEDDAEDEYEAEPCEMCGLHGFCSCEEAAMCKCGAWQSGRSGPYRAADCIC